MGSQLEVQIGSIGQPRRWVRKKTSMAIRFPPGKRNMYPLWKSCHVWKIPPYRLFPRQKKKNARPTYSLFKRHFEDDFDFFPRWYMWSFPRGYLFFWIKNGPCSKLQHGAVEDGVQKLPYPFWNETLLVTKNQKKNVAVKKTKQPTNSPPKKGTKWLVSGFNSTPLKNISQIGNLPQVGVKITNIWNHQLENDGRFPQTSAPSPPNLPHRKRCNTGSQGTTKKGMPNEKPPALEVGKKLSKKPQQNRGHSIWPNGIRLVVDF